MNDFMDFIIALLVGGIVLITLIMATVEKVAMKGDYEKYKAMYERQLEGSAKCDNDDTGAE